MRIELDAKLVNQVYIPHFGNNHRFQLYFGGASSGKSYFLAQRVVLDTLQGRNTLVLRNVAKTLRGSCWNEIIKAVQRMGLKDYFSISKTDFLVTAINNGAQILFAGLDDVEKIKSITPAKGVLTDIWVEEATEIAYDDFKQLSKRLRGPSKHLKRMTLSFNPVYKTHWLFTEFYGIWHEDAGYAESTQVSILKTTYKDNRFLTAEDVAALENETDEYYRDVYTLGNWGVLGDIIFKNWTTEDLREREANTNALYIGLDFGFSSDPAAAVKVGYDSARRTIYIFDELYERGLTNTMLAERLKPFALNNYVVCDSAEPKSIQELHNLGIRTQPSRKGPDSVVHGIQWLQGHQIIVDRGCQNMRNELSMYQWRKDKDGNAMRQPEDKNNHLIDALRYGLQSQQFSGLGFAPTAASARPADRVFTR